MLESALSSVLGLERPADLALREVFRRNPALGRRDRGVIAETVFDVLRNRRLYGHLAQGMVGPMSRRLMALSLQARFGPEVLMNLGVSAGDELSLQHARSIDPASLPQAVRLSLPDWLHAELLEQAGGSVPDVERLGQTLLQAAPLDLRVNLLKSDRPAVLAALAQAGIEADALVEPATAIRVRGKPAIERMKAFEQGWFEVQDAGSQQLVAFAAPRRGQTVVDFCAGAGGKALAMAALMKSTGQVFACDVSAGRLSRLRPRLLRSGATSIQPFGIDSENDPKLKRLWGRADLVLVDAPCSGTGTLRRNPDLKWRMKPESIAQLAALQASILAAAARLVKPGGRLVYATCSLLRQENESVVASFSAAHPAFDEPVIMRLRPDESGSDGFFAAAWVRQAS